jgi:ribosomal protein S18 acetylase RimI-like enzyme
VNSAGNVERVNGFDIATVDGETVQPLRRALLGHGPAIGDDDPAAGHVAVTREGVIVAVGSVHPEPMPGGYRGDSWRLHGIAVEHGQRGLGLGAMVLERCVEHAAAGGALSVWCRSPVRAFGFFDRLGFSRSGDPTTGADGPEYVVFAEVKPKRRSWALDESARTR